MHPPHRPPGFPLIAAACLAVLLPLPAVAGGGATTPVGDSADATASTTAPQAMNGLRLVMIERTGCIYCERWHAEVGDAWSVTPEGRAAPLVRVTVADAKGEASPVRLARPALITPTFVLARDGVEVDRLEGYPGEDFFWTLAHEMILRGGGRL